MRLLKYNHHAEYVPGKELKDADALRKGDSNHVHLPSHNKHASDIIPFR